VAGAVALAALSTGCSTQKDYRYVTNAQENLFFRMPNAWKTFPLSATDKDGRPASLPEGITRIWHMGYDSAPEPSTQHFKEESSEYPIAKAEVWAMRPYKNDSMSISDARSLGFGGFDPYLQDAGTPPRWELVDMGGGTPDIRLEFPKGVTGNRMAVNVPNTDDPTKYHTIDVVTLFDPLEMRVYLLTQRCASQCYINNRAVIDSIAQSWTVNRS
jgi:hypothetical protein